MSKELVVSTTPHETKLAILEDDKLVEIYIERETQEGLAGSLHKGRVTRVLPGMQSAFVDVGLDRDAFLYVSDFVSDTEDLDLEDAGPAATPRVIETVPEKSGEPSQPGEDPEAESPQRKEAGRRRGRRPRGRRGRRRPSGEGFPDSKYADVADVNDAEANDADANVAQAAEPKTADLPSGEGAPAGEDGPGTRPAPLADDAPENQLTSPPPAAESPLDADIPVLPGESIAKYKDLISSPPVDTADDTPRAGEQVADAGASDGDGTSGDSAPPAEEALADAEEAPSAEVSPPESNTPELETPTAGDAPDVGDPEGSGDVDNADNADETSDDSEPLAAGVRTEEPAAAPAPESPELEPPELEPPESASEETIAAPVPGADPETEEHSSGDSSPPETETPAPAASDSPSQDEDAVKPPTSPEGSSHSMPGLPLSEPATASEPAGLETASAANDGDGSRPAASADVRDRSDASRPLQRRGRRGRRRSGRRRGGRGSSEAAAKESQAPDQNGSTKDGEADQPAMGESASSSETKITDMLSKGNEILVQIAKEPLGRKGARITSHIALPGRFLVYMPTVDRIGVSRKIASFDERQRLRTIVKTHRTGMQGSFIVRTAGEGAAEEEIRGDMLFLYNLWLDIRQKAEKRGSPGLVHQDLDIVERILRDQLDEDFKTIWVDNEEEYERILRFVERFQPQLLPRVKLYTRSKPVFDEFNITQALEKALRPKVWLKSGGYIVINQTEALVAVDVNTGKYVGKSDRLEDTIVNTNVEAAEEVARQIRLRDLGGIIVIDFIDMDDRPNRQKVFRALESALQRDRAPSKALPFNDFGLVSLTRKRVKQSLEKALCSPCPTCSGAGHLKSVLTVIYAIMEDARKMGPDMEPQKDVTLRVNPEVARVLKSRKNNYLQEIEELLRSHVLVRSDASLQRDHFDVN